MQQFEPFIPAGWPRSSAVFVYAVLTGAAGVGTIFLGENYGAHSVSLLGFAVSATSLLVGFLAWLHVMWHIILRALGRKHSTHPLAQAQDENGGGGGAIYPRAPPGASEAALFVPSFFPPARGPQTLVFFLGAGGPQKLLKKTPASGWRAE